MKRRISRPVVLSLLMVALLPMMLAEKTNALQNTQEMPFPEAELFLELNDTDGDLGIHASIDGGPWTSLAIEGPNERLLLDVVSRGRLSRQGMTQLFFESAEPPFDELAPAVFFRRFPEGKYEIEGLAQGGGTLESTVVLSHVLAAPPENILLSGIPAAENCDADPLPVVQSPVVIRWDPVTESHPTIGKPGEIEIERYQLFVEREDIKLSLDLPPSVTEFEVPEGVTSQPGVYKFEIIARATNLNNTAIESCFEVN
jgi:hypothetical protein